MGYEGRTSALARAAFRCVLALALCLALAAGFLPGARAEGTTRTITVVFPSEGANGTMLALYNVGVWLDDGQIHLLSWYHDVTVPETMSADLAKKLAQDLLEVASANEPNPTTQTVAEGKVTFTVGAGAYLIAKHSGADSLGFEPLLLIVDEDNLNVSAKVSEVVTATVVKEWSLEDEPWTGNPDEWDWLGKPDDYDMSGLVPTVTVTLLADGEPYLVKGLPVQETLPTEDGSWSASISGLPKYKADGGEIKEIKYEWEENVPAGYHQADGSPVTVQADGIFKTTITNKPITVTANVEKVWQDDNNPDRPDTIKVYLREVEPISQIAATLTLPGEDGKWEATVTKLPAFRNGRKIVYSWTEEKVSDEYNPSYKKPSGEDYENGENAIIYNTLFGDVSIKIIKHWIDDYNQEALRPQSITVDLVRYVYKEKERVKDPDFSQSVKLEPNEQSDTGIWSTTVSNLEKYDEEGRQYEYACEEKSIPSGYTAEIDPITDDNEIHIRNTHITETTEVTIIKEWKDFDNRYHLRPGKIEVPLYADGVFLQFVELNEKNDWQATVSGLPKYNGGTDEAHRIEYVFVPLEKTKLDESGLLNEYYELTFDHQAGSTVTTFTNTLKPRKRIPVVKYWQDGRTDAERPAITIQLLNGTKVVAEKKLTKSPWECVFDNLDTLDEKGNEIEYTVKEIVPTGYTASIATIVDSDGVTTFVITNTPIHTPPEYNNYDGVKVWNDGGNAAGIRPAYITVHLLRDGVEVASATVTAATNWQYHFDNMPVDDGYGHIYNYTVVEDSVPGYYTVVKGSTIINGIIPDEPKPPKTEEELEKVVDLFNHDTPLFDRPLGTGDVLPIYPFVFAGIGLAAVVLLLVLGRRRRRS